jgi:hypothetical protein
MSDLPWLAPSRRTFKVVTMLGASIAGMYTAAQAGDVIAVGHGALSTQSALASGTTGGLTVSTITVSTINNRISVAPDTPYAGLSRPMTMPAREVRPKAGEIADGSAVSFRGFKMNCDGRVVRADLPPRFASLYDLATIQWRS